MTRDRDAVRRQIERAAGGQPCPELFDTPMAIGPAPISRPSVGDVVVTESGEKVVVVGIEHRGSATVIVSNEQPRQCYPITSVTPTRVLG